MLYLSVGINGICSSPRVLYGYIFDGIYSTSFTAETDELAYSSGIGLDFSKGFFWKNMSLKLGADFNWSDSPYLMQNQVSRVSAMHESANADLSFEPFRFMALNYSGVFRRSQSLQGSGDNIQPLMTLSNSLTMNFRLPAGIGLSIEGEHYYNSSLSGRKSFCFLDAGLNYTYKKIKAVLNCTNLLDTDEYTYSIISAGRSFTSRYSIRPRAVILKIYFTL